VNLSAELVVEVPADVVTVTSTAPVDPAGALAVSEVAELTLNEVAATEPNLTAVAPVKPVPVTVTEVPPAVGPEDGLTEVTVGVLGGGPPVPPASMRRATAPETPLGL
jgi:hypothetical protein